MKFVEQTGANWAQQIRAVEMEIEQQKREWEEKRLIQLQQEDQERIKTEKEENELLTYSREDALNKVNIKSSSTKSNRKSAAAANNINNTSNNNNNSSSSSSIIRIKSENASQSNHTPRSKNNSNGTQRNQQAITRNGIMKSSPSKRRNDEISGKSPFKRHLRNTSRSNQSEETLKSGVISRRALSRKSDRSSSSIISKKTNVRSISESTRSTSMSRQTSSVHDDSDSECSLDVMIDSNDVNDSDSNSNVKAESNFDSTSQDDDTAVNDDIDSTITDETTIEKVSKSNKTTSSPRTRSRGTVKIDLWTLDDSPILPPKRQKTLSQSQKSTLDNIQLKEFGMKECKVSIIDIHTRKNFKASPQSRTQKRLLTSAKNNHTLDSWIQKVPEAVSKPKATTSTANESEENDEKPKTRTTRRNATINKTL